MYILRYVDVYVQEKEKMSLDRFHAQGYPRHLYIYVPLGMAAVQARLSAIALQKIITLKETLGEDREKGKVDALELGVLLCL
jgi:hypothetical protein